VPSLHGLLFGLLENHPAWLHTLAAALKSFRLHGAWDLPRDTRARTPWAVAAGNPKDTHPSMTYTELPLGELEASELVEFGPIVTSEVNDLARVRMLVQNPNYPAPAHGIAGTLSPRGRAGVESTSDTGPLHWGEGPSADG
jgi:hypothetical protein